METKDIQEKNTENNKDVDLLKSKRNSIIKAVICFILICLIFFFQMRKETVGTVLIVLICIASFFYFSIIIFLIMELVSLSIQIKGKRPGKYLIKFRKVKDYIRNLKVSTTTLGNIVAIGVCIDMILLLIFFLYFLFIRCISKYNNGLEFILFLYFFGTLACFRILIPFFGSLIKKIEDDVSVNTESILIFSVNMLYLVVYIYFVLLKAKGCSEIVDLFQYIQYAFVAYIIFGSVIESWKKIRIKSKNEFSL